MFTDVDELKLNPPVWLPSTKGIQVYNIPIIQQYLPVFIWKVITCLLEPIPSYA